MSERLTKKQRLFDAETTRWPLYRTSKCGAITIDVAKDGTIRLTPFLTERRSSFRDNDSRAENGTARLLPSRTLLRRFGSAGDSPSRIITKPA